MLKLNKISIIAYCIVCAVGILIFRHWHQWVSPTTENLSEDNVLESTIAKNPQDSYQKFSRDVFYRIYTDTLSALPIGTYFSSDTLSGHPEGLWGMINVACDEDNPGRGTSYQATYWLYSTDKKQGEQFKETIVEHWKWRHWTVVQSEPRIIYANPVYDKRFTVITQNNFQGYLAFTVNSPCFLIGSDQPTFDPKVTLPRIIKLS